MTGDYDKRVYDVESAVQVDDPEVISNVTWSSWTALVFFIKIKSRLVKVDMIYQCDKQEYCNQEIDFFPVNNFVHRTFTSRSEDPVELLDDLYFLSFLKIQIEVLSVS